MSDTSWLHRLIAEKELSRAELRAGRVLADQPDIVVNLTITELAELAHVGEATISRLCRKLGFSSYHALKIAIATRLATPTQPRTAATGASPRRAAASQAWVLIEETARLIDQATLDRAVEVLAQARRTDIYGVGSSGLSAQDARARFAYLGLNCNAPTDHHFQKMAVASLEAGDALLIISANGSTRELIPLAKSARHAGTTVIVLTGAARSPLGKLADILLPTGRMQGHPVGNLMVKMTQLFAIELLASALAERLGPRASRIESAIQESLSDSVY